ncbi:hypothetical protein LSAT2_030977 [Lamellibrachia satsuma]|nr:hypothetical protein LSAT2_030977 [Lamellibrachia satsuma]
MPFDRLFVRVENCHKIWGITQLLSTSLDPNLSEYTDHYRRRVRQPPTLPFLPKRFRFSKRPMAKKSDYQDTFVSYLPRLYKARQSEKQEYKTSVIATQKHNIKSQEVGLTGPCGGVTRQLVYQLLARHRHHK